MRPLLLKLARWSGLNTGRCPACGVLTESGGLCPTCAEALAPRTGGYCPTCGDIYGDHDEPVSRCGECRTTPPPWDQFHFHGIHAGTLRDLILGYKFYNGIGRTALLSQLAVAAFYKNENRTPDYIVPVPLHPKRLHWRGFNQSVEIATALGKELGRPVLKDGLVRTRDTVPQTALDAKARQENIKNAFESIDSAIAGKTVLLVDDVFTTGATLTECTRILKGGDAAGVDVLVLARAIR